MARPPRRPSAPGSASRRPSAAEATTASSASKAGDGAGGASKPASSKASGSKTGSVKAPSAKASSAKAPGSKAASAKRPGSTPGGAAPRSSRPPRAKQPPVAPSSAWVAGVRGSGFTLLVMGIMILAVVVLAPSVKNFVEQRAEIAELQRSVDAAKTQSQNLDEQRVRWSDPAFIRAQARERLYFVMPGEVSYLVLDDIAVAQQAAQPASDSVQKTQSDWAGSLLSSIAVAGLGDPTADELTPEPVPAP
ncbi:septum formation initiator family protein [Rathayibacter sp. VKM Ac-2856]|uniref:FtsB family cell division protein n=1 Tax=unclassified Rathayibacter TaxID=2609250 RepID=UPI0015652387|nr:MULTISPECIES: septum formation initiator family protein [unclassified Rathayibacter]NQX06408.1 septum formation initiator family protein [Rathayibacter sp. VKM Ac-2858]NQX21575.1 septum formation initiator family protein [Rathayibacter sp. VKM Ac-2856]